MLTGQKGSAMIQVVQNIEQIKQKGVYDIWLLIIVS